jgi:LiaF transmembrane domain
MNGGGKIAGPALILVGLLMLLGQMGMPVFGVLWPLLLLAIGVGMILRYRQGGEDSGLVFSGVLLVLLTILLLGARTGVLHLSHHWPAFLAAVGVSFLAMAQVDSKRRDAMVPGWICLGVAAVLYFFSLGLFAKLVVFLVRVVGTLLKVIIPLVLMGFGGWLLFHDRQEQNVGAGADFPEKVPPDPPAPPVEPVEETAETVEAAADDPVEDAEFEALPDEEPKEEPIEDEPRPES